MAALTIICVMNIILLGYRGCGKTTIGRKLADQLWMDFVDVDQEICKRFGIDSIKAIWEQHGEAAFRELESVVVVELVQKDDLVIALGGGTVMQDDGRHAIERAEHAIRVYLKCTAEELHRRIMADPDREISRPHITAWGNTVEDVQRVLTQREPIYEQIADHIFDVTHLDTEGAVHHLIKRCL